MGSWALWASIAVSLSVLALFAALVSLSGARAVVRESEAQQRVIQAAPSSTGLRSWVTRATRPLDTERGERVALELVLAGWRDPQALTEFVIARLVLAIAAPAALLPLAAPATAQGTLLVIASAGVAGYLAPSLGLGVQRRARVERLAAGVPVMLDLLVSAVEAGLGVDVALRHVARELTAIAPDLTEELEQVNDEMSTGVPRAEALRRLAERTGVEELTSVVTVLGQADRYGSGVARSLRAHARLARQHRALEAETRAANASPKLTVLMILFILPALFVVLMGPSVVRAAWVVGL